MGVGTRKSKRRFLNCEALEDRAVPAAIMSPTFELYHPIASALRPYATPGPTGTSPTVMRQAYGINQAVFGSVAGDGTGQTIAIVDAYNEPTITNDLAAFDTHFGLSAPPSFKVVNQSGGSSLPAADSRGGWGVETALDVEWAHVVAPRANILVVEANSASFSDLMTAVDTARSTSGVSVVSMSWGGNESASDTSYDFHFTTPSGHNGVTFVASSGDNGAGPGVSYPAVSPNVLGVGGTTLSLANGGYGSESGWSGSGGGISNYYNQPSYQKGVVTQSSTARTVPDVAMDANPNSGVPVYDAYDDGTSAPWLQVGGTSLAAPMWAGVIAIADQGRVLNGLGTLNGQTDTLPKLYALPSSSFHDITTGNNGYAATTGYDLVTGLGTPIVNQLVNSLAGSSAPVPPATSLPTIGTFTVNPTSVTAGTSVTLAAVNVTETGGAIASVKFYRESNGTAGLQTGRDTLVGSGSQSGSTWSLTASTTGLAPGTYTFYAVATDEKGASSTVSSATLTVTAPNPPPKFNPTTTSSLSSSVAYLNFEEVVTLTVKVSVAAGQPAPTGIVYFYVYGQRIGYGTLTATSGGATATINFVLYGHGYANFSTSYGGDPNYNGSSSSLYRYI